MSIDKYLTVKCRRCGNVLFTGWLYELRSEACGEYDDTYLGLEPCEVCTEPTGKYRKKSEEEWSEGFKRTAASQISDPITAFGPMTKRDDVVMDRKGNIVTKEKLK